MEHLGLSSSAPVMTGEVRRKLLGYVCSFCDQEGLYRCTWEEEWFVVGCYRDLKAGDRVRRFHDEKQAAPAIVEQIEDCGSFYKVLLKLPGARKYGYRSVNVQGPSFVRVARIAPCNKLVCDRHVRELGEGRYWCRDHWRSWEAMIPALKP